MVHALQHDAITTFNTEGQTTDSNPCNVHLQHITVAPNLELLGMGGSVPGFRNGQKVWDGFPYATDQEYGKDLSQLVDPVFGNGKLKETDAVILMTHGGPDHCSKCMDTLRIHAVCSPSTLSTLWARLLELLTLYHRHHPVPR